jgi:hypothetical protein
VYCTWTTGSALGQLSWEPTERRASAVAYLRDVIENAGPDELRELARRLLTMADEERMP